MIRVFIIAASSLARAGLQSLFAGQDVEVAGSAANFDSLADHWSDAQPDVILVEASGGPSEAVMDSLAASELAPEAILVVLSDNPEPAWLAEALRAGVRAVLPSDVSPDLRAYSQVSRGLDSRQAGRREPHRSRRSRNSARYRPPLRSPRYFSKGAPSPHPGWFLAKSAETIENKGVEFLVSAKECARI